MKKNILIVIGCAALLMFSTSAYSAQGAYFTGNVGLAMMDDSGLTLTEDDDMGVSMDIESKTGLGLGLGLGYDLGNSMRIEAEFAYQKNDMEKLTTSYMGYGVSLDLEGETTSSTLMVNGYYDFVNLSAVTPFISAGIGYSNVEAEITGLSGFEDIEDIIDEEDIDMEGSEDDTVIAYQIGAGIGYTVSETLTLDAKYRYFKTDDLEFEGVDVGHSNHNFYIGIRLGF